jgi:hypothetical protein
LRARPYDLAGILGVSFWAKSGTASTLVNVAVAQTSTDIALAEYDDVFDSTCLCTEAAREAGEKKSCQGHYYVPVELSETWQQCWVFFRDMAPPSWAQDQGFDPTQAIKLMWQMPEPSPGEGDLPFDVWVDEVRWITEDAVASGGLPRSTFCGQIDFQ